MADPQVTHAGMNGADADVADRAAGSAVNEAILDADVTPQVWRADPLQTTEMATTAATIDPFDDLQPMLDLRFPEELANAETVESATPAEQADVLALVDDAVPLVACERLDDAPRIEILAETVDAAPETSPTEVSAEIVDTAFEPVEASAGLLSSQQPLPESSDTELISGGSEPMLLSDDLAVTPADQPSDDWDARQKIADEANATAQALENLKQLIAHKMPGMEIDPPTVPPDEAKILPPPIQAFPLAHDRADGEPGEEAELGGPIDVSAVVSEHRYVGRRPAWQGFLAGFMASWAIGAALYAYLVFA